MELNVQELISKGNTLEITQRVQLENYQKLHKTAEELHDEVDKMSKELDLYICGCKLLGEVTDAVTQDTLDKITSVINKALGALFPRDSRTIKIRREMHKNVYPHFVVDLITENGVVRSFKQSGSGLAQVISFLFTICLIDARGGRKILVMDELLNGLHPDAKSLVRDLMTATANRFQYVVVEYGMDTGAEYLVDKNRGTATVTAIEGNKYYKGLNKDE